MVTLVVAWSLLSRAGFVEKVSSFLVDIGFADGLTITGPVLARGAALVGAALVVHNTVVTFLLVLLYNLFSSLFGGLIVSVIEERLPGVGEDAKTSTPSKTSRRNRGKSNKSLLPTPATPVSVRKPAPKPTKPPSQTPMPARQVSLHGDDVTTEDRWLDELD